MCGHLCLFACVSGSYCTDIYFHDDKDLQQRQLRWLTQDLSEANHDRAKRPWIVAFGQHPLYCTACPQCDCASNTSLVRAGSVSAGGNDDDSIVIDSVLVKVMVDIEGFRPEWYILTIYHCRDKPFWLETLELWLY